MAGWEEVDPDEIADRPPQPFQTEKSKIDPIVFVQTDSNPELRWNPDMVPKRPAPTPAPRPVSTGETREQWVPGGKPKGRRASHAHPFAKVIRIAIVTAAPLGAIAGVAVLMYRAYGLG